MSFAPPFRGCFLQYTLNCRRKLSELTKKQRKYKTVYWYLEEFLKPEYAPPHCFSSDRLILYQRSEHLMEFLHTLFLKPEYARKIYEKFADFKEMIDYAYEEAMGVVKACTFVIHAARFLL